MSVGAHKRLMTELKNFKINPSPNVDAAPSESDILTWFYVIDGPRDTAYERGEYIGRVTFPSDYPFKPPHIQMITPNGRFEPNSNICMSMTAWHPESWQPSWQCATILQGLASFMGEESSAIATIKKSAAERKKLAENSRNWNIDNVPQYKILFPDRHERSVKIRKGELKIEDVSSAAVLGATGAASSTTTTTSGTATATASAVVALTTTTSFIDPSAMKNSVVAEAVKKANEALLEKEAKAKAARGPADQQVKSETSVAPALPQQAPVAVVASAAGCGARRQREEESNGFGSAKNSQTVVPSNSAAQKKQMKKKSPEVIELE